MLNITCGNKKKKKNRLNSLDNASFIPAEHIDSIKMKEKYTTTSVLGKKKKLDMFLKIPQPLCLVYLKIVQLLAVLPSFWLPHKS